MLTSVGKIEIANSNPQSENSFGFQMSPYLQETAVLAGQENTYEKGSHILKKTMGVEISSVQLHRLCNCYGEAVEKQVSQKKKKKKKKRKKKKKKKRGREKSWV